MSILQLKKIINESLDSILREVSNEIPGVFWLVTSLNEYNEEFAEQLGNGVLEGVSGISDNRMIVSHFFGIGRDAILVLPGQKTVSMNNIEKVRYDNIEALLKDDMKLLYRVWNRNPGKTYDRRSLMENLLNYVKNANKPFQRDNPVDYFWEKFYFGEWRPHETFAKSDIAINNINDLSNFLYQAAKQYNEDAANKISPKDFMSPIQSGFQMFEKVYRSEGEWVVHDDSLKIPKGSRLLLGAPKKPQELSKEKIDLIKSGEKISALRHDDYNTLKEFRAKFELIEKYGLDKKYDIRWVNMRKFEQLQKKMLAKDVL